MMSNRPSAQRANVKALTHWVIRQGYTMRFTARQPDRVAGILNTPDGAVEFTYDPAELVVHLPDRSVSIDAYGWEKDQTRNQFGSVTFDAPPVDAPGASRTGAWWKPRPGKSSDEPAADDHT